MRGGPPHRHPYYQPHLRLDKQGLDVVKQLELERAIQSGSNSAAIDVQKEHRRQLIDELGVAEREPVQKSVR